MYIYNMICWNAAKKGLVITQGILFMVPTSFNLLLKHKDDVYLGS